MSDTPGATVVATFNTRRQADLALEHFVQELGVDCADIVLAPEADDNSAGSAPGGVDAESGHLGVDPASDPAIAGRINLSVDLADDQKVRDIRAVLEEIGGEDIAAE
jgi:hypothetical protein